MKTVLTKNPNQKPGEKTMKTSVKLIFILSALFIQNFAKADCGKNYFEGEFINDIGDHFKITQTDCDHISVKDLQLGDTYQASTGSYTLQPQPTSTDKPLSLFGRNIPVSLRLGELINENSRRLYIRFTLPVYSSNKLANPTIEIEATLSGWLDNGPGGTWSTRRLLNFWIDSFQAVHKSGESVLQKAFIEGINVGLDLMSRTGFRVNEFLSTKYQP